MTKRNRIFFDSLLAMVALTAIACGGSPTDSTSEFVTCAETIDCSHVGGACVAGECHADNECATDADCTAGDTCVTSDAFGGLCTAPGDPPAPLPPWSCSAGADCPEGQGCASDGLCHVDGECTLEWTPDGNLETDDCAAEEICATSGLSLEGFCTEERMGPDPTCRSDGDGACRVECAADADCGGGTCEDGFCHQADECATADDCWLNHLCALPEGYEDYGISLCYPDPNPLCVDDGEGVCRLQCDADVACTNGGGCEADGLCHASNECDTDADCEAPLLCYPDEQFGGLCGPERPDE
jgi:hypothetical protein